MTKHHGRRCLSVMRHCVAMHHPPTLPFDAWRDDSCRAWSGAGSSMDHRSTASLNPPLNPPARLLRWPRPHPPRAAPPPYLVPVNGGQVHKPPGAAEEPVHGAGVHVDVAPHGARKLVAVARLAVIAARGGGGRGSPVGVAPGPQHWWQPACRAVAVAGAGAWSWSRGPCPGPGGLGPHGPPQGRPGSLAARARLTRRWRGRTAWWQTGSSRSRSSSARSRCRTCRSC